MSIPSTLYDKIWAQHIVYDPNPDDTNIPKLIYVDRHLLHEVTSPQAFNELWSANRSVRRPDCALATADHNVPTTPGRFDSSFRTSEYIKDSASREQYMALKKNARRSGIPYFGLRDKRQGIIHVIGGEQGFILPGVIAVCGDSHTSSTLVFLRMGPFFSLATKALGALGALAFGIGTSEVEHVLATQTLHLRKSKNMRILVQGSLPLGVTSKDIILHIIRTIGTAGGIGYVIEYAGEVIRGLSVEARMVICNMSIEAGARAGLVEPDEKTWEYLRGRPFAPSSPGKDWNEAVECWKTLRSDEGAKWDKEVLINAAEIQPTVTWGTLPEDSVPISGNVPTPDDFPDNFIKREGVRKSLEYMGLNGGEKIADIKIDKVFLGSCTNSRIEDLRTAARILLALDSDKRKVAEGVEAMVVPGSGIVKQQAETEGLDVIFKRAGFQWREPGCSMCVGLNEDRLGSGERCASTSNRNFRDRQGTGGRTHLVSPATAVGAAVTGKLVDIRKMVPLEGKETGQGREGLPITLSDIPAESSDVQDDATQDLEPESSKFRNPNSKTSAECRRDSRRFTSVRGIAAPLRMENVDTDMIVPAPLLKGLGKSGLADALFNRLRFQVNPNTKEEEEKHFILNKEPFRRAKILICVGRNFGCGSSREHAVWALKDFGFTCIIAPSFGDIFFNNCLQNGVLLISLPQDSCENLANYAETGDEMEVDLLKEEIKYAELNMSLKFTVDVNSRSRLLKGLDDIDLTLSVAEKISDYEAVRKERWHWLELDSKLGDWFKMKKMTAENSMEW